MVYAAATTPEASSSQRVHRTPTSGTRTTSSRVRSPTGMITARLAHITAGTRDVEADSAATPPVAGARPDTRGGEAEVDEVPDHEQRQRPERQPPQPFAGDPRHPRDQAGVHGVLLDAVGRDVQPPAERGERARVARDLAVHAVDDQRGEQQQRAQQQPARALPRRTPLRWPVPASARPP